MQAAILAVALASSALVVCRDAPRLCDKRPLGRIAGRCRKSMVYNSLQHIASLAFAGPPHEGVGAHLAAGRAGRLPFLVCKHYYTIDSNYRANRAESDWGASVASDGEMDEIGTGVRYGHEGGAQEAKREPLGCVASSRTDVVYRHPLSSHIVGHDRFHAPSNWTCSLLARPMLSCLLICGFRTSTSSSSSQLLSMDLQVLFKIAFNSHHVRQ